MTYIEELNIIMERLKKEDNLSTLDRVSMDTSEYNSQLVIRADNELKEKTGQNTKPTMHYIKQNGNIVMESDDQKSIPIIWNKISGKAYDLTLIGSKARYSTYIEFVVLASKEFVFVEGEIQLFEDEKLIETFDLKQIS